MTFQNNIFDLTPEQEASSKMMYSGKIIKCLVAPYHSNRELEESLPYTDSTYLFPERDMTGTQVSSFISMIVRSDKDNIIIITKSQNIISDMIHHCVRILTEGGDIVDCPSSTFAANIHTIRYDVLENPDHQLSDNGKSAQRDSINDIIDKINSGTVMGRAEYDETLAKINLIGEPIIRTKLIEMISGVAPNNNY
tara:strand:- start:20264 stop:20848 length:585 start_codon:yes stop_codon:yes gene_type:complete